MRKPLLPKGGLVLPLEERLRTFARLAYNGGLDPSIGWEEADERFRVWWAALVAQTGNNVVAWFNGVHR